MPRFSFQRRVRTSSSEQFNIFDEDSETYPMAMGQTDIHYITPIRVQISLVIFEDMEEIEIEELLAALDDNVVNSVSFEGRSVRLIVFMATEHSVYELGPQFEYEEGDEERPSDESQIV